jgi:hypothetical protein
MPQIDLSILNQRQTPAFYADVLANRPAAGFVGRIFISTNTFAFFRDNGTGWDLIGGPGTGTVTGSGANGQVSFWNGASSITGNNDLFWDSVNGHLGIGTNVPGTALQIDHDQNQFIRLNQTTATNDTKIAFQNSGIALWRIGNSYNAGANDFGIYDVVGSIQPVTVKKTTGQVLIGTSTVGSGKLVVASATSDNHIQIVGAAAPSLRIDSAESGPTKRIGIGLATAVNNFIQNSQNLDMCIFNGSTSAAGNMLFGIYDTGLANIQEAARISSARNFLIGTITDTGQKLQVSGTAYISTSLSIGTTSNAATLQVGGTTPELALQATGSITSGSRGGLNWYNNSISTVANIRAEATTDNVGSSLDFYTRPAGGSLTQIVRFSSAGNVGIQTTNPRGILDVRTAVDRGVTFTGTVSNESVISGMQGDVTDNLRNLRISGRNLFFNTGDGSNSTGSQIMHLSESSNVLIGTSTDNGQKLRVNGNIYNDGQVITSYQTNAVIQQFYGNSNNQGTAQRFLILRQYSVVSLGTKLIIPFVSQPSQNNTTVCRVWGHGAKYNSRDALGFEINFSVGSLTLLQNLSSWGGGGNFASISIAGMNIEIDFTSGYTSATADGIFVTIEYMTAINGSSIDVPNITMN